nr:integrase, catalytic region, zinc finger, CCHC-type, peptidase aspartic, catalytic [Tanacetum cinerariifolium]
MGVLVTSDVPEIYMQEFWATATFHHHSISFNMDNKKHIVNLEEIRKLTDVNINKLHQPWRSFVAVINKCLSKKTTCYDSLRLSQAQILWEAVATACYTQNQSIVRVRHGKIPYELLHNKLPDLSFFHVFGALCYPTNDSENLGKLQPKADIGIFIGYAPSKKAFRIYNRCTR